ncbi:uncharacterized protein BJ171DRAFT_292501 [Polychytrium aggregatum]|uniref:uncharacterized protein n=1 Tax=Polychytrium aggregatum TaxID=110093 RepID=UPI0022FEDE40|nr:uncharacterized protein BJ171DRAFT_292501 [Polychytrium aggregatum]KAI9207156.1 hypothetical protein BJ171DRAFT_292501 [Polychytrium aggregatum]
MAQLADHRPAQTHQIALTVAGVVAVLIVVAGIGFLGLRRKKKNQTEPSSPDAESPTSARPLPSTPPSILTANLTHTRLSNEDHLTSAGTTNHRQSGFWSFFMRPASNSASSPSLNSPSLDQRSTSAPNSAHVDRKRHIFPNPDNQPMPSLRDDTSSFHTVEIISEPPTPVSTLSKSPGRFARAYIAAPESLSPEFSRDSLPRPVPSLPSMSSTPPQRLFASPDLSKSSSLPAFQSHVSSLQRPGTSSRYGRGDPKAWIPYEHSPVRTFHDHDPNASWNASDDHPRVPPTTPGSSSSGPSSSELPYGLPPHGSLRKSKHSFSNVQFDARIATSPLSAKASSESLKLSKRSFSIVSTGEMGLGEAVPPLPSMPGSHAAAISNRPRNGSASSNLSPFAGAPVVQKSASFYSARMPPRSGERIPSYYDGSLASLDRAPPPTTPVLHPLSPLTLIPLPRKNDPPSGPDAPDMIEVIPPKTRSRASTFGFGTPGPKTVRPSISQPSLDHNNNRNRRSEHWPLVPKGSKNPGPQPPNKQKHTSNQSLASLFNPRHSVDPGGDTASTLACSDDKSTLTSTTANGSLPSPTAESRRLSDLALLSQYLKTESPAVQRSGPTKKASQSDSDSLVVRLSHSQPQLQHNPDGRDPRMASRAVGAVPSVPPVPAGASSLTGGGSAFRTPPVPLSLDVHRYGNQLHHSKAGQSTTWRSPRHHGTTDFYDLRSPGVSSSWSGHSLVPPLPSVPAIQLQPTLSDERRQARHAGRDEGFQIRATGQLARVEQPSLSRGRPLSISTISSDGSSDAAEFFSYLQDNASCDEGVDLTQIKTDAVSPQDDKDAHDSHPASDTTTGCDEILDLTAVDNIPLDLDAAGDL